MENRTYSQQSPGPEPGMGSPVPAWDHYAILKFAEEKIMRQLEMREGGGDSEEFLAGLAVGYIYLPDGGGEEREYAMSFGYAVDVKEELVTDEEVATEPSKKDPLDEAFIDRLYDEVRSRIVESAPANGGEYLASLVITTGHCSLLTYSCWGRRCGICRRHAQRHIQRLVKTWAGSCRWACTGSAC